MSRGSVRRLAMAVAVYVGILVMSGCGWKTQRKPSATQGETTLTVERISKSEHTFFAHFLLASKGEPGGWELDSRRLVVDTGFQTQGSDTLSGNRISLYGIAPRRCPLWSSSWPKPDAKTVDVKARAYLSGSKRGDIGQFEVKQVPVEEPLAVATQGDVALTVAGFARPKGRLRAFVDFVASKKDLYVRLSARSDRRGSPRVTTSFISSGSCSTVPRLLHSKFPVWERFDDKARAVDLDVEVYETKQVTVPFRNVRLASPTRVTAMREGVTVSLSQIKRLAAGEWTVGRDGRTGREIPRLGSEASFSPARSIIKDPWLRDVRYGVVGEGKPEGRTYSTSNDAPGIYHLELEEAPPKATRVSFDCVVQVTARKVSQFIFKHLPLPETE